MEEIKHIRPDDHDIVPGSVIKSWERQPGEDTRWYERFVRYFLMQPPTRRTLMQAYRMYRIDHDGQHNPNGVSESWNVHCTNDAWIERAADYDAFVRCQYVNDIETVRKEKLAQWSANMAIALDKATGELASRDMTELPHNQLLATVKTLGREYHQNTKPPEDVTTIRITAKLPVGLQKLLQSSIE